MMIYITAEAYLKMTTLVSQFKTEVAWHGVVELVNKSHYIITDILVFPQTVSSVHADSIDLEYEEWLYNLPDKQFNNLRMHGHSHVHMSPSPSHVDLEYRNNLMTQVEDYYIFLIINKKGDTTIELRNQLDTYECKLNVLTSKGPLKKWLQDAKEVVHEPKQTHRVFQSWYRRW